MTQQRFLYPAHQDPWETPTPVCLKVGALEHTEEAGLAGQWRWGLQSPTGDASWGQVTQNHGNMVAQRQDNSSPETELKVTQVSDITDLLLLLVSRSVMSGSATPRTAAHQAPLPSTPSPHWGPQQLMPKPQAENQSSRRVVPRTPTSSMELPSATGRRLTTPATPAASSPAWGNGTHKPTGQPQTQGDASHPSSFPLQLSILGHSDLTPANPHHGGGGVLHPSAPQQQRQWQQGPMTPETHTQAVGKRLAGMLGWKRCLECSQRPLREETPKTWVTAPPTEKPGKRPLVINLLNSESK